MPPNGWKWVVLAGIVTGGSLVGAYFHVVSGEVPTAVIAALVGLFARSPLQNGGQIGAPDSGPALPRPPQSRPSINPEEEKKNV